MHQRIGENRRQVDSRGQRILSVHSTNGHCDAQIHWFGCTRIYFTVRYLQSRGTLLQVGLSASPTDGRHELRASLAGRHWWKQGGWKLRSHHEGSISGGAKYYGQVLWLYNDEVTEVGAMNVFFVFQMDNGKLELVTPPLDRGDILPGVTRDSILHLARTGWGANFAVSERFPTMTEIQRRSENGTLLEAFGAGTAAVVTPIGCIQYKGKDIEIPAPGPIAERVWNEITEIQYGNNEKPKSWSVLV